jgi:DNA primase
MFEEAVAHMKDAQFDSGRYFLSHSDPQVSKLASELMSDRYHLSKIHARILGEEMGDKRSRLLERNLLNSYVPRATTELKNFYVLQKIEELKEEMKSGDRDDYVTLITRLKQLQEMKKVLAKELGERIVLKY